jgi:hypothetical protein
LAARLAQLAGESAAGPGESLTALLQAALAVARGPSR